MLIPIVVGQVARIRLKGWVDRAKTHLSTISNTLILLIVLFAMARTAGNQEFTTYLPQLPWPFLYLAVSHIVLVGLTIGLNRLLRLSPADQITALFVAPQKTLALGAPLLSCISPAAMCWVWPFCRWSSTTPGNCWSPACSKARR